MKQLRWFALLLEISPLLAFTFLAIVYPVGDPQNSPSSLVRVLDFQGTYWIRNGIPVPPPLLVVGLLLASSLWWRHRFSTALAGTVVGLVLLGFWSLIMIVPLFVRVN